METVLFCNTSMNLKFIKNFKNIKRKYKEHPSLHRKIYMESKCKDAKDFRVKTLLPSKSEPRERI